MLASPTPRQYPRCFRLELTSWLRRIRRYLICVGQHVALDVLKSSYHIISHGVPQHCLSDSMQPCSSSIRDNSRQRLRVRAGIVLYIAPLGSAGNHNASPRREGLERRNLASRSLLRACFGPINVEFRGGAICEAYRGRPAGLARSRHFVATAGDHTPRSRARIAPAHPDHATTHPNHPQPRTTGRSRRLLGHSSSPCK